MRSPPALRWGDTFGFYFHYMITLDQFVLKRFKGKVKTHRLILPFSCDFRTSYPKAGIVDHYLDGEIHIR